MISGPKFMDTEQYDIVAKAPADVALSGTDVDADTILAMLRTLLIDRFKIKFHSEDQPINIYALIAQRREPRLKQADPQAAQRANAQLPPMRPACLKPRSPAKTRHSPNLQRNYPQWPLLMSIIPQST